MNFSKYFHRSTIFAQSHKDAENVSRPMEILKSGNDTNNDENHVPNRQSSAAEKSYHEGDHSPNIGKLVIIELVPHKLKKNRIVFVFIFYLQKLSFAVRNALEKNFVNEQHSRFTELELILRKVIQHMFMKEHPPHGSVLCTCLMYVRH